MRKAKRSSDFQEKDRGRVLVDCSPHLVVGGGRIDGVGEGIIEDESPNERSATTLLALCCDVTSIASQPTTEIFNGLDGKEFKYTPDYRVDCFVAGLRLEVKSIYYLLSPEGIEKYTRIAAAFRESDTPFRFLVDAQIQVQPRLDNAHILLRYLGLKPPEPTVVSILSALRDRIITIATLIAESSAALLDVYVLIANRHLAIDWAKPLSVGSEVSLPNQPFKGVTLADILDSTRFGPLLASMALGRRPEDRRLLADAEAWRQPRQPPSPWAICGGFTRPTATRDIGSEEFSPRDPEKRRDFAPGIRVVKTSDAK